MPEAPASLGRELLVGVAVVVAVVVTFALAPIGGSLGAMRLESAGRVVVAGVPVAVGLYAWRGVPFGRLGILLVLSGVVWFVVTFSLADRALAYSIGRVADWVGWAALVYLMLAFPDGRLVGRVDRALAAALGLVVAVLWLPTALLVNRYPTPSDWVTCSANCPHNAFMIVSHEPGVVANVVVPLRELLVVLLFLAVVARLVQRIASASRIRRRTLTPVLAVAAAGIGLTAVRPGRASVRARLSGADRGAVAGRVRAPGDVAGISRRAVEVAAVRRRVAASVRRVDRFAGGAGRGAGRVRGRV